MNIIFLDTETTGLKQEKGARIIEIALIAFNLETRVKQSTWIQRFNPQCAIEAGAQEVHGIAYSDLVGEPTWEEKANEISRRMGEADLLVAHNMGFDGPFIAAELNRVGVTVPDVYSTCTMTEARWACPDGKLPRLGELAFALAVEYDPSKAHSAEYDVLITAECFFRGFDRGFYELPKALRAVDSFKNCHDAPIRLAA